MPASVDFTDTGRLERRYVDVFFQALHDAQGQVDGILNFSYDVTEQELARQQVQSLNKELAAINKELRASNEEYLAANTALSESQQQLQQLTQALEARVQERTQQLEMALAEAGRQRQSLVELVQQAPAAMCIVKGPDFVYETFNPLYAAMFGGRPQLGRPMREVLPEVVNHPGFLAFRAVYEQGRTIQQSEVLVPLARPGDGVLEDHYFSYTQQPRYDQQGQIDGVFVFAVEVTEQVLARQQVEQLNQELEARVQERTRQVETARAEVEGERALLQALFTQAPIAIGLYTGENLLVVAASNLLANWLGQSHAHVVGRPLLESTPELRGQGFDDLLRQVMATQVPFIGTETLAVTRRNGELYTGHYNLVYQPLYAADRQVIGVVSVAVDVTEQVLARRQVEQLNAELETRVRERTADLQESENRFRTMADAAPAMLWVTDPDGQCTYLNAQWHRYTGQSEAEALGMGWTQAVHPDDAGQAGQKFLEANARRASFYIRYRLRRHDGVYRWAVDAGRPHFTEDGAYAGIVGTVSDIHEQQLAEDELHATNKQLMRTNVDLDNFIYTASHDLKAPITNIEGLLLALEHELPAAARTGDVPLMLSMMQDAIERFRRTIAHLTDLSRLQKEYGAESDVVPLASVVEAVRLDLGPLLAQGQLMVTIPPGLTVTFAEKNLRSVVYNLLSNAFKYRHPDRAPEVRLRSWLADGYPVLEVQDNGLGLDLAQGQEKLFAMFQRLHTHVEGTGIGLYMVKRILENAGGRIEVTSKLGQGSTFRVYFRG